jgi:hypothetical protein
MFEGIKRSEGASIRVAPVTDPLKPTPGLNRPPSTNTRIAHERDWLLWRIQKRVVCRSAVLLPEYL